MYIYFSIYYCIIFIFIIFILVRIDRCTTRYTDGAIHIPHRVFNISRFPNETWSINIIQFRSVRRELVVSDPACTLQNADAAYRLKQFSIVFFPNRPTPDSLPVSGQTNEPCPIDRRP